MQENPVIHDTFVIERHYPSPVARVFHALGDSTRRALLEKLSAGPASVSSLAEPLRMSLPAVVQHLQILEESGLISTRKTGRVRICSVNTEGLRVAEHWINERRAMWEKKLDRLGEVLGEADH